MNQQNESGKKDDLFRRGKNIHQSLFDFKAMLEKIKSTGKTLHPQVQVQLLQKVEKNLLELQDPELREFLGKLSESISSKERKQKVLFQLAKNLAKSHPEIYESLKEYEQSYTQEFPLKLTSSQLQAYLSTFETFEKFDRQAVGNFLKKIRNRFLSLKRISEYQNEAELPEYNESKKDILYFLSTIEEQLKTDFFVNTDDLITQRLIKGKLNPDVIEFLDRLEPVGQQHKDMLTIFCESIVDIQKRVNQQNSWHISAHQARDIALSKITLLNILHLIDIAPFDKITSSVNFYLLGNLLETFKCFCLIEPLVDNQSIADQTREPLKVSLTAIKTQEWGGILHDSIFLKENFPVKKLDILLKLCKVFSEALEAFQRDLEAPIEEQDIPSMIGFQDVLCNHGSEIVYYLCAAISSTSIPEAYVYFDQLIYLMSQLKKMQFCLTPNAYQLILLTIADDVHQKMMNTDTFTGHRTEQTLSMISGVLQMCVEYNLHLTVLNQDDGLAFKRLFDALKSLFDYQIKYDVAFNKQQAQEWFNLFYQLRDIHRCQHPDIETYYVSCFVKLVTQYRAYFTSEQLQNLEATHEEIIDLTATDAYAQLLSLLLVLSQNEKPNIDEISKLVLKINTLGTAQTNEYLESNITIKNIALIKILSRATKNTSIQSISTCLLAIQNPSGDEFASMLSHLWTIYAKQDVLNEAQWIQVFKPYAFWFNKHKMLLKILLLTYQDCAELKTLLSHWAWSGNDSAVVLNEYDAINVLQNRLKELKEIWIKKPVVKGKNLELFSGLILAYLSQLQYTDELYHQYFPSEIQNHLTGFESIIDLFHEDINNAEKNYVNIDKFIGQLRKNLKQVMANLSALSDVQKKCNLFIAHQIEAQKNLAFKPEEVLAKSQHYKSITDNEKEKNALKLDLQKMNGLLPERSKCFRAHVAKIECFLALEEYTSAIQWIEKIKPQFKKIVESTKLEFYEAACYMIFGQYKAAREIYERIWRSLEILQTLTFDDDERLALKWQIAKCAYYTNDFGNALQHYSELLDYRNCTLPLKNKFAYWKIYCLIAVDAFDEATQAITDHKGVLYDAYTEALHGYLAFKRNRYDEAHQHFSNACQHPNGMSCWQRQLQKCQNHLSPADLSHNLQKTTHAHRHYFFAPANSKNDMALCENKIRGLLQNEQYAEAIRLLNTLARKYAETLFYYFNKAYCLEKQNRPLEAIALLQNFPDQQHIGILKSQARLYRLTNQSEQAFKLYHILIRISLNHESDFYKSIILYALKQKNEMQANQFFDQIKLIHYKNEALLSSLKSIFTQKGLDAPSDEFDIDDEPLIYYVSKEAHHLNDNEDPLDQKYMGFIGRKNLPNMHYEDEEWPMASFEL